jgi:hypothetical protein
MERPLHELLWLSCAAKRCCSARTVLPTGADIWRIATRLQAPPESFLRPVAADPNADDAFLLAPAGQLFHAALARRTVQGRVSVCVFLMQLGDRAARCGLDGLRPLPCRSFPAESAGGALRVGDDLPCTCRCWSLADLDRAHASALLRQEQQERRQYHAIIQAWNARVGAGEAGDTFPDFCSYLLDAYTQPAARGEV